MPHWGATKSRSLRSLSRPDGRSRPREFASLIRCGCGGVPRWGPQIRAAQWGGREKTGAPTRLFLGLVARALSAPPLALGIFLSSGCSFLPGRGVAPRVAGARRVPLAGHVSSAPPPSTARGGLVGRSGPFRAGRLVAGASRLPNPLWCGLVLGPSLFRCAGRCRSLLRCLWVTAQPVIIIFLPAGVPVCFCVLGPGVGFCLARSAFRPAPNGARVCVVGGVVVVVGPRPRCPLGPQTGRARAKCGACAPVCRGPAAPGGGGLLHKRYTECEHQFAERRGAQPATKARTKPVPRRGLSSRLTAGKTAQGSLPPALGWFRALPASLLIP